MAARRRSSATNGPPRTAAPVQASRTPVRLPRGVASSAGPLVIVASVLVVMRGFLGGRVVSDQHADLLTMWIPTFTHLGRAIADLHVPDWNPHAFAGMPFAADPQSGWTYLPAMVLFSVFAPGTALNALLLLNPLLIGLGVYGFLRSEGVERPAATVGGLLASIPLAGSRFALSTPLIGALGWTAVMLACASRAMRERRPARAVLWSLAAAVSWGQVANAHLSNGLVIASGLLVVYLLVVVAGERSASGGWDAWRRGLGLVAALPVVNLVVLLPRLRFLSGSSISTGYAALEEIGRELSGAPTTSLVGLTSTETSISLASLPAPYLGALGFALVLGWVSGRRSRPLGVAFLGMAVLFTLFASQTFAEAVQPILGTGRIGGFLTHEPIRFFLGEVLALGVLGGFGAAHLAEMSRRSSGGNALVLLVPGFALWALSALGQGARFVVAPLGLVAVAGLGVALLVYRRHLAWILVGLVAYDLVSATVVGSGSARFADDPFPLRSPAVVADDFLAARSIESEVAMAATSGERFAPWAAWEGDPFGPFGLLLQGEADWASGGSGRGMLIGGMDVGGYNPSQPERTWLAMRRLDPSPKRYNQSFVGEPSPALIDLLNLRWVIAQSPPGWATAEPVATDGAWSLHAVPGEGGLASFPSSLERAVDAEAALEVVAQPGFDPRTSAVWEGDASLPVVAGAGEVTATWERDDRLVLELEAARGGLLVVRLPWDAGWRATIDGEEMSTVPVDGFVTGVLVPAGSSRLVMDYEDRSIAVGALVSLVGVLACIGLAWALRRRPDIEVVPRSTDPTPADRSPSPRAKRGR